MIKAEWIYKEIQNTHIKGFWCSKCHIGQRKKYINCPICGAKMKRKPRKRKPQNKGGQTNETN